jgi:hypothetical protein
MHIHVVVNRTTQQYNSPQPILKSIIRLLTRLSHLILTHAWGPRELGLFTIGTLFTNMLIIKMGLPLPVEYPAEAYPAAVLVLVPVPAPAPEPARAVAVAAEPGN